jgi:hypothetical protein
MKRGVSFSGIFMDARRAGADSDIKGATPAELHALIIIARDDIRWHRDQRGHDRCWLDDLKVYSSLPEYKNPYVRQLCTRAEFLARCDDFFENRQNPNENPASPAGRMGKAKDSDLQSMDLDELGSELLRLRGGIREHRSKGRTVSWEDDSRLYSLLPDKKRAITKLPEKERLLRGCRKFCSSRGNPPKLHEW